MYNKKNLIIAVLLFVMLAFTACMPDVVVPEIPEEPPIVEEPKQEEEGRTLTALEGLTFTVDGRSNITLKSGEVLKSFTVKEGGTAIEAYGKEYPITEDGTLDVLTGRYYLITIPDNDTIILKGTTAESQFIFRRSST